VIAAVRAATLRRRPIGANPTVERILVAEDSALVAMDIELMLQEMGCQVVGPVAHLDDAVRLAGAEDLDGAIVDVELQGGSAFAVADLLQERGIPFVFATGFTENRFFAAPYDSAPRLQKPYDLDRVREAVASFAERRRAHGHRRRPG